MWMGWRGWQWNRWRTDTGLDSGVYFARGPVRQRRRNGLLRVVVVGAAEGRREVMGQMQGWILCISGCNGRPSPSAIPELPGAKRGWTPFGLALLAARRPGGASRPLLLCSKTMVIVSRQPVRPRLPRPWLGVDGEGRGREVGGGRWTSGVPCCLVSSRGLSRGGNLPTPDSARTDPGVGSGVMVHCQERRRAIWELAGCGT